jgi:hypothetical protein
VAEIVVVLVAVSVVVVTEVVAVVVVTEVVVVVVEQVEDVKKKRNGFQ